MSNEKLKEIDEMNECLEKVSEWMHRQKSASITETRFYKFLKFANVSLPELFDMTPQDAETMIEDAQKIMLKEGIKDNSILTYVAAIKRFFKKVRRLDLDFQLFAKQQKAKGYHSFSNGDLGKIYEFADAKYKALISLSSSCGFGISDILKLDKDFIHAHVQRARENNEQFCFIEQTRKKTNSDSLLVINPLAMESLENWIRQNPKEKLFPLEPDAVNTMLKKLVVRSGIKTTGKIKFHKIRSWVISSLIKAGFQTEQWKYIVGKSVKLSDSTYMDLKEGIVEKYPQVYAKTLNILSTSGIVKSKDAEIKDLNEQLGSLRTILVSLIGRDKLVSLLEPEGKATSGRIKKMTIRAIDVMSDKDLLELYAKSLESESNE